MFVEQTFYGFRKAKNIEKGLDPPREKKMKKGSKRQSFKVAKPHKYSQEETYVYFFYIKL